MWLALQAVGGLGTRKGLAGAFFLLPLMAAWLLPAPSSLATIFEDVTEQVGLAGVHPQVAAAWGDFDRDGWPDLLAASVLWRNEGGKKFTKVQTFPGVYGGLWGDFDNDGFPDIYFWDTGKLFRNIEGKRFEDVSDKLPPRPMEVSRGAAWGDLDGDGYLDLYVGGSESRDMSQYYPDVIFRNQKGTSFTEAWREPGPPYYHARGITEADFDEDGRLDIYVSNYRLLPNQLWHNDGDWKFRDVGPEFNVAGRKKEEACFGHTIGSCWGDLDNDGHFDLFVGNFSHPPAYQDRPQFLRNCGPEGAWHFEDESAKAGLRWQESYGSPALGDFDNDGLLDLYYTTVYSGDKCVLYRNNGNWKFAEIPPAESGVAADNTYQSAWADFDNDGRLDLVSDGRLFHNVGPVNHWLKVRLEGAGKVNRSAIGAQVRIRLGERTLTRQVEGATGEGNQNDLTLHFGLGDRTEAVAVEVRWPDGSVQTCRTQPDCVLTLRPQASAETTQSPGR